MKAAKTSTKHPYAAIEHRVIDSPAYASLSFSARALLVIVTRQLSKDNNGHLQATFAYLHRFGFDSETTLGRCIRELISRGMIYRTRSGGFQQGAAQYAVTWLSITDKEGLFLAGFKPCAWRDWQPDEKKSAPQKMETHSSKKGMLTTPTAPKNGADRPPKNGDIEYVPCRGELSTHSEQGKPARATATIPRLPQVAGGRMEPVKTFH